jgi:hypothetical protein
MSVAEFEALWRCTVWHGDSATGEDYTLTLFVMGIINMGIEEFNQQRLYTPLGIFMHGR